MSCRRCPHHVRHGQVNPDDANSFIFRDVCGLILKQGSKDGKSTDKSSEQDIDCHHYPFPREFDYGNCEVYLACFKSAGRKNDVIPTKDFQYSEALSGISITDMELL